jgi:hypothetical protein
MFPKNNDSETGFVSSSGKIMAAPTLLSPLEKVSLNHWAVIILPEDGNRFSFRDIVFYETLGNGQSP